MPKATQKQKLQKADFSKAKLKLGKGKQQPSNATNTSFKARSIALPGQAVLTRALNEGNATGEATTAAGLALDEVMIRTRHPNAGVKRDAIQGIKDILSVDVGKDSGRVLATLGGLLADEDASVRKALYNLLSWYLPLARSVLSPHLPMLTLLTSSALSHIFAEIRLDAAKIVSLLLEHDMLARTDSNGILQGLCLALGSNPPAKHKLVYLNAIEQYVRREAVKEKEEVAGRPEMGYALPIRAGGDVGWQLGVEVQDSASDYASTYDKLYPTLLSTFLEAVPSLPASLETNLCIAIASIAESLADRPVELLKRMDPYFPFSIQISSPSGVGADVRLNSSYSKMAIQCQGERLDGVTDWILDLLAPTEDVLQPGPTAAVFEQLESVMAALLATDRANEVAAAIIAFALRQGSTSALRTASDSFIIRMINQDAMKPASDWLDSLPRVLWELGGTNESASRELLTFLLRFGQQSPVDADLSSIPPRLAAFYTVPAKRPPYARLDKHTQKLALDVARVWIDFDPSDKLVRAIKT